MIKRHEELIKSVDDICKSLEKAQPQKVELKVTDILPPIPAENIAALTRTQVQVTGVLEKVAGRLDEAGKRDGQMMDSLTRVDGSLSALSRASEKSVTTMDGMKGVFAKVSGSMEAVQSELKKSSRRYETLCEKVQKADQESAETIVKLQKRTLVVTGLLGIALVATLVIVSIGG
jgi:DNA repair ATPase RecN